SNPHLHSFPTRRSSDLEANIQNSAIRSIIELTVSIGLAAPFLWAVIRPMPVAVLFKEQTSGLVYNKGPLLIFDLIRILGGSVLIDRKSTRLNSSHVKIS